MRLFIAEKPSLARAIAAVLPQPQKASRLYIEAGNDVVAWAAGHLLEQAMPEQYDEKYKRWNLADLPIIPEEWKMLVKKESKDLFDNLKALLKKAESVVNAGDCDREGQLLIDEILEYCKYNGPVQRILISDTNPDAVRKALAELKPNDDFRGDRDAARARSQADWLHGMNMTRLYTKLAEKNGYDRGPLRIGRVKTPVTALVATSPSSCRTTSTCRPASPPRWMERRSSLPAAGFWRRAGRQLRGTNRKRMTPRRGRRKSRLPFRS